MYVKNFWNAKKDPPKCLQLVPKMPPRYTQRPKPHSKATQISKKSNFFRPELPWGSPQTLQNRLVKASQTSQNRCSFAYAYRLQLISGFGFFETRFWGASWLTSWTTFICVCTFLLIFNFSRMSLAFYMFLIFATTAFWHREQYCSITFWTTSPACVSKPKRGPKTLSKWLPKPAAEAFLSTWKGHPKPRPQKLNFLRPGPFGGFAAFQPWTQEMGPRL